MSAKVDFRKPTTSLRRRKRFSVWAVSSETDLRVEKGRRETRAGRCTTVNVSVLSRRPRCSSDLRHSASMAAAKSSPSIGRR